MSIPTTRFITLFPLLCRPYPHRFIRVFTTRRLHHHRNHFLSPPQPPSLSSTHLFTTHSLKLEQPHYSDSDWFDFLNRVTYNDSVQHFDDFVDDFKFQLPLDVFRVSNRCLAFARSRPELLWSLPREDIEVVVENVSPALFKDGSGSATRMKAFLGGGSSDVFNFEKPATVDLMRFLLSYAGMKIVSSESVPIDNRVESAVRKLFSELAKSSEMSVKFATPVENQAPQGHGRTPKSSGKNIEMKRGDWICPLCNFMNFAKNHKCLECEEPRPMRFVTGKEWQCPQCNFFNFGKNVTCLRCDCKNLRASPNQSPNFISGSSTNSSSRANVERSSEVEERQQSWFTKIKQLESSSDTSNSVSDADFLVAKITKDLSSHQKSDGGPSQTHDLESDINVKFSQHLDEALGEKSSSTHRNNDDTASSTFSSFEAEDGFPETMPMRRGENRFVVSKKKDRSLTSPMYKRRMAMDQGGNSNYVPFVPFPPDYFATDKPKDGSEITSVPSNNDSPANSVYKSYTDVDQTSKSSNAQHKSKNETDFNSVSCESSENQNSRDIWKGKSLEGSAVKEPDPLDMSEEAKAERWFRRVAQIKDISELSQIPDEDFPSIMPMRKGVNRFVVSKRKTPLERRLTSSKYQMNRSVLSSDPLKTENDSS